MPRPRRFAAVAVTIALCSLPAVASAHPTEEFDACVTSPSADFCDDIFSYLVGDTVVLRGSVSPDHAYALVLVRPPRTDRWQRWGRVEVSDTGSIVFRWHTHRHDGDQLRPYRMKFRIPGHGVSDVVRAYVLFGE
jgi:hypothetical protein